MVSSRPVRPQTKQDSLGIAEGLSTLLNTPEYFAGFKTIQDYNLGPFEEMRKPERIAAKEAAEKRAREIEEKMGIQGVFYRKPSPSPSPAPAKPRPHS